MSDREAGPARGLAVEGASLRHRHGTIQALDDVSVAIRTGSLTGLIGPDGVGKSTLLSLIAGVRRLQQGILRVLDGDIRDSRHRAALRPRVGYMPQGLGTNLYAELTVLEHLYLFGRLYDLAPAEVRERSDLLLEVVGLRPFADRRAGMLSGGLRQKLALACALVHQPALLVLDEPTTGVDPLSRRQFWDLIAAMRRDAPDLTLVVATSYMDEAEQFDRLLLMDAGRTVADGTPADLKARAGAVSLAETYVRLLPAARQRSLPPFALPPRAPGAEPAIEAFGLTRRFGAAIRAVDGVSFTIERGEIFGFVGPNGSGKTTTMRMVAGLLPASAGEVRVFGRAVRPGDRAGRRRMGYMSQTFSLYAELTVRQNLALHARLFDLPRAEARDRVETLAGTFELGSVLDERAETLPLGMRQRLSLAVATVHSPELLILDEPTAGVDPIARDGFWHLLGRLSREQGTTIFLSTHYLAEASRCDRVALMHAGRVLACASPGDLAASSPTGSFEDAFVSLIRSVQGPSAGAGAGAAAGVGDRFRAPRPRGAGLRRLWALTTCEALQVRRDPFRLFWALVVPIVLLIVFGTGLSLDIEAVPFAALDRDRTPESRTYLDQFRASRAFAEQLQVSSEAELDRAIRRGQIRLAIEVPSGFGRALRRGRSPEVGLWVDGTMPFRAETVARYVEQANAGYGRDLARNLEPGSAEAPARLETRFWFNQSLRSKYAFVPGLLAIILLLMPATLTAVAVVRERELGSIANFYATPATRGEFVLAKQLPYAALSLVSFASLTTLVVAGFEVPLRGSFLGLALGAVPYVLAGTALGMLVSSFTRTQAASALVTVLIAMVPSFQYSGLLSPVSALRGAARAFARVLPTTYYLSISVGAFTKGLGPADVLGDCAVLALMAFVLSAASVALLQKQER